MKYVPTLILYNAPVLYGIFKGIKTDNEVKQKTF